MRKTVIILTGMLFAAVVVYSFLQVGSPAYNRLLQMDELRVRSMSDIDCALRMYYHAKGRLPAELSELETFTRSASAEKERSACGYCNYGRYRSYGRYGAEGGSDFKDPETGAFYEFTGNADSYTICSTFSASWEELKKNRRVWVDSFKDYQKGRHCFERKVERCDNEEK